MVDTRYPNRFFGANPVSLPSQGKREEPFSTELPRSWRAALGVPEADGPAGGSAAQSSAWDGQAEQEG